MKHKLSGKLDLYSIGKCDDGGLGLGKTCLSDKIKRLDYNSTEVQFLEASLN